MADMMKNRNKMNGRDPEEEEEWLMYDERKSQESLNRVEGAFTEKAKHGINTEPSVFDRTAVFRMGNP
ncbi:MAG: hypothetical protein K6F35_05795 [Lachnospiraceae bacterium]|nr:hypothetical protein [Lachnospiraceae bacterium]